MLITEDHLRIIPWKVANVFLQSALGQSFSGLYWFEKFFNVHHPQAILELGTGPGTLTCLFGMHCPDHVVTCDQHEGPDGLIGEVYRRLGITYCKQDVMDPAYAQRAVAQAQEAGRCFIFCDNGNKQAEFALYAPFLSVGDAIAVHDFGTEFHLTPEANLIIEHCKLKRWREDSEGDGSLLAFWIKEE